MPHLTLCASACFRRRAYSCSKHSFCRSRQSSASRCKLVVKIKCVSRGCRNLKRWARKRFPPSPLPRGTPPQPPSKNYRMLYTALGGIKGATFCSALQLSHRFKMLSWSYNGGFFENYLCVGKMVASIAQGEALCSIGKAATSMLPPLTR